MIHIQTSLIKIQRHFRLLAAVTLLAVFGWTTVLSTPAHAALSDLACDGLRDATGETCDGSGAETTISDTVRLGIQILILLVTAISIVMIIIGGIRYVTSQGDPGSTKSARDTIIYAVIGLAIAAVAQIIVLFVVDQLTGIG